MPARFPMYDFLLPVLLMPIEQDTDAGIAYRRAKCRQDEKGNRKPYLPPPSPIRTPENKRNRCTFPLIKSMINSGTAILPTYPDATPIFRNGIKNNTTKTTSIFFSVEHSGRIMQGISYRLHQVCFFPLIRLIQQKYDCTDVNHRINSHADSQQKKRQNSQRIIPYIEFQTLPSSASLLEADPLPFLFSS